jgi:hypothetical protein
MPSGDRTGPWGRGPRTGRAAGYCAGYDVPGYANPGFGRGRGRGFGRGYWGHGRRLWRPGVYPYPGPYYPEPYPEPSREEEKTYLEDLIKDLENELKTIRERLQEISKEKKEASP